MNRRPATPSGGKRIRIFLVAEHAALRQNLALLLEGEGMVLCGWAGTRAAALRAMPAETDLVIVGLSAGGQDVPEFLRQMTSRPGSPPALVLSADDDDDSIRAALAEGASAYVPNRLASEALAHAIREVLAGRKFAPRSLAEEP